MALPRPGRPDPAAAARTSEAVRDLHAVVAGMHRQARGLAAGPEPAALTAIQSEGQHAVAALQWLLHLLRAVPDAAAPAERLRLAREVHDRAGHAVGVMVVQAGAAQALRSVAPGRAREAAVAVQAAAVEALCQLDLLAWLVDSDGADPDGADPDCSR